MHLTNKQSNVHTEERKEIFERVVKTVVEYGNKEFPEEKERSIHGIFPYRFINRKLQERINSRDLSALIQDSQKISPDSSCSRRNKGLSKGYFHIDRRNSKRKREEEIQIIPNSRFTKDNNFRKKLGEDPESLTLDPKDNSKGRKGP